MSDPSLEDSVWDYFKLFTCLNAFGAVACKDFESLFDKLLFDQTLSKHKPDLCLLRISHRRLVSNLSVHDVQIAQVDRLEMH